MGPARGGSRGDRSSVSFRRCGPAAPPVERPARPGRCRAGANSGGSGPGTGVPAGARGRPAGGDEEAPLEDPGLPTRRRTRGSPTLLAPAGLLDGGAVHGRTDPEAPLRGPPPIDGRSPPPGPGAREARVLRPDGPREADRGPPLGGPGAPIASPSCRPPVPFAPATRAFLTAALVHLAAAAAAVMLGTRVEAFTGRWDLVVWLLLLGFIGFTTAGFALHLFPPLSRRSPPPSWAGSISFLLAETGLVLGAAGLAGPPAPLSPGGIFSLGALLVLAGDTVILAVFLRALAEPRLPSRGPEPRPGDAVTVPLFLGSWIAAVGSGGLFFLSGRTAGPGFGWWIAAVHLFVLGHAVLLIVAVSLRLLPRSLDADVGRPTVALLAALAGAGALLVPLGMLRIPRSASPLLGLLAAPEAAFTVLFLAVILVLLHRARHPPGPRWGFRSRPLSLWWSEDSSACPWRRRPPTRWSSPTRCSIFSGSWGSSSSS